MVRNGKKVAGSFANGIEDGRIIEWYENGQEYREQNFKNNGKRWTDV